MSKYLLVFAALAVVSCKSEQVGPAAAPASAASAVVVDAAAPAEAAAPVAAPVVSAALLGLRWFHQFPDSIENHFELSIVFLFESIEFPG